MGFSLDKWPFNKNRIYCDFYGIVAYDHYRVKQYPENYFDFIFDIGANVGVFSVFMKMLHPFSTIVSLEPSVDNFNVLRQNTRGLGIHTLNVALGNGKKLHFFSTGHSIDDRFTEEGDGYAVDSITLVDLLNLYNCSDQKKYLIKSDCEGGEKYLLGNPEIARRLKTADQISLEIHFKTLSNPIQDRLEWAEYDKWVHDVFSDSHEIDYYKSNKRVGYGHYCIKKKHTNRQPLQSFQA